MIADDGVIGGDRRARVVDRESRACPEVPPPGEGVLHREQERCGAHEVRPPGITASSVLALTNVVASGVEPRRTTEEGTKVLPVTAAGALGRADLRERGSNRGVAVGTAALTLKGSGGGRPAAGPGARHVERERAGGREVRGREGRRERRRADVRRRERGGADEDRRGGTKPFRSTVNVAGRRRGRRRARLRSPPERGRSR